VNRIAAAEDAKDAKVFWSILGALSVLGG